MAATVDRICGLSPASSSCVENWAVTDREAGYRIINTEDEVDKGDMKLETEKKLSKMRKRLRN